MHITIHQQKKLDWLKLLGATPEPTNPAVMYFKGKQYTVDSKGHIKIQDLPVGAPS